jgi:agmatine deiminase
MLRRMADWEHKKSIWLAWPFDPNLWGDELIPCQQEFLHLIKALNQEELHLLFPHAQELKKIDLSGLLHVTPLLCPYSDIWLRDTMPIMVNDNNGPVIVIPRFNGWGQKYELKDDTDLSKRVAQILHLPILLSNLVLEGGALDFDGQGTLLTTEQCLLNPNRNPNISKKDIEQELLRLFGVKKIIWLKRGLHHDHTDGHVDNIARFIAPHTVAILVPHDKQDPNFDVLMEVKSILRHETDANNCAINLLEIPSPGVVLDHFGNPMPASYLNFLRGDFIMAVPLFGSKYDEEALAIFKKNVALKVVGLMAKSLLHGGGSFHCIAQEFFRGCFLKC